MDDGNEFAEKLGLFKKRLFITITYHRAFAKDEKAWEKEKLMPRITPMPILFPRIPKPHKKKGDYLFTFLEDTKGQWGIIDGNTRRRLATSYTQPIATASLKGLKLAYNRYPGQGRDTLVFSWPQGE